MSNPAARFLIRWLVSILGLWIAAGFLNGSISYGSKLEVIILAGLLLAAVNTVVKPLLILFSLPALLFTLGLFMLVINGATVYLTSKLYPALHVSTFWAAVFAGMVVGLVNYLVTAIVEERKA